VEPLLLWQAPEGGDAIEADAMLVKWLRPHQREGLQFMFECVAGLRMEQGRGEWPGRVYTAGCSAHDCGGRQAGLRTGHAGGLVPLAHAGACAHVLWFAECGFSALARW
jgi:hypothetical protein